MTVLDMGLVAPARRRPHALETTARAMHAVLHEASTFERALELADTASQCRNLHDRIAVCLALLLDVQEQARNKVERLEGRR